MSVLALALALLPAPALAEERGPGSPDGGFVTSPVPRLCRNPQAEAALPKSKVVKPRTLNEEPAATEYYAVLRIENGCTAPQKVNEARDASAKPQP